MDTMQTDANCSKSEDCTMFIQVKHALPSFRNYHDGPTSTSKHPYQYYHYIPYCFITIHVADQTLRKVSQSSPPLWEVLLDRVLKVERKPKASCPRKVDSSNAEKYRSQSRGKKYLELVVFTRNLQQIKHVAK